MLLCCFIKVIDLNVGFEKRVFFNKIPFLHKTFHNISGKILLLFHQQASSLYGRQTYHRTNSFLPYKYSSCYESDYECICIAINGKTSSVPLNILSNVFLTLFNYLPPEQFLHSFCRLQIFFQNQLF